MRKEQVVHLVEMQINGRSQKECVKITTARNNKFHDWQSVVKKNGWNILLRRFGLIWKRFGPSSRIPNDTEIS
jgi:hypothetical protein